MISSLWWLILCVNLTEPKGVLDIWLNIILSVSVRVFLDGINIESVKWVKQISLPNVGGPYAIMEAWIQLKDCKRLILPRVRRNSYLAAFWLMCVFFFFFFCLWIQTETQALPGSQVYWPLNWNYIQGSPESLACQL